MENAAYKIFLFLLVFAPLAFGTTELWSLTIMEVLSYCATLLFILSRAMNGKTIYKTPGLLPFFLFLLYLLIQVIPLPPGLLSLISSETYKIYQESVLIVAPDSWLSISINKKASLQEFYRYSCYFCIYFLAIQIFTSKHKLKKTINTIIAFSAFLAVFALIQYHSSSRDTIYWLREVPINAMIFGPYVNHNHFAGLMEMILPLSLAMLLYMKPHIRYESTFREKFVDFFDLQGIYSHMLFFFSTGLIALAIIMSLSRSAVISVSFAIIVYTVMLFARGKTKNRALFYVILFSLILLSINWFGWDRSFYRFGSIEDDFDGRMKIWEDSAKIINKHMITGVGFGNFRAIYPRYRSISSENEVSYLFAHNDYLELFIEGGIIGAGLVLWFLVEIFKNSFRIYQKRRERYSIYLFLGSFTGVLAMLFHSFTDFNLHIGANGLYFFILFGLMVSTANTRHRGTKRITILKPTTFLYIRSSLGILASISLISGSVIQIGAFIGTLHFASVANMYLSSKIPKARLEKIEEITQKASNLDPLEGKYHYTIANVRSLISGFPSALKNYEMAIKSYPFKADYLQRVGLILSSFHLNAYGERLLKAGIKADNTNPEMYRIYANWLLSNHDKSQSLINLKTALSFEPKKINQYISLMLINGFSEKEIFHTLPKRVIPYFEYGDYLLKKGNNQKAEQAYLAALSYVNNEKKAHRWFFGKVYNYYYKVKRFSDALKVMVQAVKHRPKDAQIRIWTAKAYHRLGIFYRAVEEYKAALTIDPKNKLALKGLKKLEKN